MSANFLPSIAGGSSQSPSNNGGRPRRYNDSQSSRRTTTNAAGSNERHRNSTANLSVVTKSMLKVMHQDSVPGSMTHLGGGGGVVDNSQDIFSRSDSYSGVPNGLFSPNKFMRDQMTRNSPSPHLPSQSHLTTTNHLQVQNKQHHRRALQRLQSDQYLHMVHHQNGDFERSSLVPASPMIHKMPPKIPYKQAMGAYKKSLLQLEKERKREVQMLR